MTDTKTSNREAELPAPTGVVCSDGLCNFVEEYYGHRCSKCGQFLPNTAPPGAWLNGVELANT
jgi:hypothetical protein